MDLPVGFACDVHPAEVAAVVFGVCAPKQQLAAWLSCGVSEKKARSHQHQRQGEENPSRCPQNTHKGIWGRVIALETINWYRTAIYQYKNRYSETG